MLYQEQYSEKNNPEKNPLTSTSIIFNGGGNGITGNRASVLHFNLDQKSNNTGIDNLIFGSANKWGTALGQGTNLTFSFSSRNSTYSDHTPSVFVPINLTEVQINAARQAIQSYANISKLIFTEIADTSISAGDIRWGRTSYSEVGTASAYMPGSTPTSGDIWFGTKYETYFQNPVPGGYGYQANLHELGHALGLTHPHMSAVPAEAIEDQLKYSVMSYRSYKDAPLTGYSTTYYPTSLMLNDIASIQYLYGVNTGYQSGNNTYSWAPYTSIFEAIYDGGGIDTIDASNQALGVTLNLNPGSWSQIGKTFWNGQTDVRDCLTIAYSTTIENAIGSTYNDILIGNSVANILNGGLGADSMLGGAGDDTYYVDNSGDSISENANEGTDTIYSSIISYTLGANLENLTLTDSAIYATGNNLDNKITGNNLHNELTGQYGNDVLIGLGGNDTYRVIDQRNVIIENPNEGIDTVFADVSYTLSANVENLTFTNNGPNINGIGNDLNNIIIGRMGNNILDGKAGNDTLQGWQGNDILIGGTGSDTYLFNRGDGADVVREISSNTASAKADIDVFQFGESISSNQLWFSKKPDYGILTVSVIGTTDQISIESWYNNAQTSTSSCYIEKFQTVDGKTLTYDKVDQLVNAMAAFSPPALGQTTLPSNYQQSLNATITAAWS